MRKLIPTTALIVATTLSACATAPEAVAPSYVSSTSYASMNCNRLNMEAQHINSKLSEATGRQQAKATSDATMTAISLLVFWPAAFFISGDGAAAGELARLKGEAQAVNEAAIAKGC